MDLYTLLYLRRITTRDRLFRELCSMLCGSLDGRGASGRMDVCVYNVWLSYPAVHLKLSQRCELAVPQYKSFFKKRNVNSDVGKEGGEPAGGA